MTRLPLRHWQRRRRRLPPQAIYRLGALRQLVDAVADGDIELR